MDLRNHYRFKALIKVLKFLKDNEEPLSEVAAIGPVETALKQMEEGIIKADGIATGDASGFTVQKANVRESLVNATMTVMRGMHALAHDTDDTDLTLAARYTRSKLVGMTDSGLYIFCKKFHELALPLAEQMADYNVTEAQIALILTLAERFYKAIADSAKMALVTKTAHQDVIDLLKTAYALMDKKLDVMLDLFLEDDPDLVEGYRLARTIGHHSAASSPDNTVGTVQASDPVTIGPLRYGATKGLLLVNASEAPMHFQLLDSDEALGKGITLGRISAFMGVMADLADRGNTLHVTTGSESPASYRVEIG